MPPLVRLPLIVSLLVAFAGSMLSAPVESQEPKVHMDVSKVKVLTYSPTPEYPKEARKNHWGGSGLYEIHFRRDGLVSATFVILSTGHKVLDDSVTSTLRQWHSWKGYKAIVVAVTITFTPGGKKQPTAKSVSSVTDANNISCRVVSCRLVPDSSSITST